MKLNNLAKYAWITVAYNIFVVLWGAFVRATGSGAGCGSHWPTCNGDVIPRPESIETAIEFTHRITSGIAFLMVLGLLIWITRTHTKGSQLRNAAWGAMIFMISESLVGAGLVLFEWVAGNLSVARVVVQGIHLANTMMLLFCLTLTAWHASGGKPIDWKKQDKVKLFLVIGFIGTLFMSMAGAVTALGDTFFPAETLTEGIQQDFSPTANFLVRLRVWHPVFAMAVGVYLFYLTQNIREQFTDSLTRKFSYWVVIIFSVQLGAGALNLILLVPVWMQLVHLFLATLVWIALTLLSAAVLANGNLKEIKA